jgi:alkylation response protein AidB-like acyl-CoA dehydrogenase
VTFALSTDQRELQVAFREFVRGTYGIEQLREAWESESGESDGIWAGLAELGVLGVAIPEEAGGLGLGEVELVAMLEEAGYVLLAEPLAATAAVAAPLIAEVDPSSAWLEQIAAGKIVVAVGLQQSPFVADAQRASLLLLADGANLHALDPSQVELVAQPGVDRARRLFSVSWSPSEETVLAHDVAQPLAAAFDRSALAAAAELLGLGRRLIDVSADYARDRRQFGQPIGSFQAVKHMLADALVRLEFSRPAVYRAAASVALGEPSSSLDVSVAKALASDAAVLASRVALQVHGAIGYTWEHDLHYWLAHTEALGRAYGDARWHRERVATLLLDDNGPIGPS